MTRRVLAALFLLGTLIGAAACNPEAPCIPGHHDCGRRAI
jgi:hypothetical protein